MPNSNVISQNSQALETDDNGNIAQIVKELDPKAIVVTRAVVENIVKTYDTSLNLIDYTAELGSAIGDNYMAIMYLVNIKVQDTKIHSDEPKVHSIMLKTMPLNPARQTMVNDTQAFVKEATMYGKVFPAFELLQKKLGFSSDEIYSDYPKCYASFVDGKTDYLALENLRTKGYKMADRQQGLDKAHVTIALKSLAKFHALSYVQFHGDYEAILQAYPELEERLWADASSSSSSSSPLMMTQMFVSTSLRNNIDSLRSAGFEKEAAILEEPEFSPEAIMSKMSSLVGKPVKHAVLGHGDNWTNNMLFKYDPTTGQPIGIKMIDFQISRPSSRTIDLHYFLLPCPQDHLVNDCEEEFLHIYYDEFSSAAKKLGFFEPELTFKQLQDEYNEFRAFGVIISLMTMQFFYAKTEDVKDMEGLTGELSEGTIDQMVSGMMNEVVLGKIRNILNVHLPKVKL